MNPSTQTKICNKCNALIPIQSLRCQICGHQFPVQHYYAAQKLQQAYNIPKKSKAVKVFVGVIILFSLCSVVALINKAINPSRQTTQQTSETITDIDEAVIGKKPLQSSLDGSVMEVKQYLRTHLNDYDSSEFVEWSPINKVVVEGQKYWAVRLKLRAKNAFGAYIVKDTYYFIRDGVVVRAEGL